MKGREGKGREEKQAGRTLTPAVAMVIVSCNNRYQRVAIVITDDGHVAVAVNPSDMFTLQEDATKPLPDWCMDTDTDADAGAGGGAAGTAAGGGDDDGDGAFLPAHGGEAGAGALGDGPVALYDAVPVVVVADGELASDDPRPEDPDGSGSDSDSDSSLIAFADVHLEE